MSHEGPSAEVIWDGHWKSSPNETCGVCGTYLADCICPICRKKYEVGQKIRCNAEWAHYESHHWHLMCEK
jgi:hypothetical protein